MDYLHQTRISGLLSERIICFATVLLLNFLNAHYSANMFLFLFFLRSILIFYIQLFFNLSKLGATN